MDVKAVIIWVCVAGAAVLILAEVIAYLRLAWSGVKALKDGSQSLTQLAEAQATLATGLASGTSTMSDATQNNLSATLAESEQQILDAGAFLDKVVDLLKTLGAKVPLLVGAIVLLLLAAFLAGAITVSASVGTEGVGETTSQSEGG